MPSNDQYALMAGAAYASDRGVDNQIPVPEEWYTLDQSPNNDPSGFKAYTFGNAPTLAESTEIVIAYAGTDPGDITGDWPANAGLATGTGSEQLVQASAYYLAVKAANPDTTITLTGRSLGGHTGQAIGARLRRAA